jgi:hypothetical protein
MKRKLLVVMLVFVSAIAYSQASKAEEEALVKASLEHAEVAARLQQAFPNEIVLLDKAFPFSEGFYVQAGGKSVIFKTKDELGSNGGAALIFWRLHIVEDIAYVNFILQEGEGLGFAIKLSKVEDRWEVSEAVVEGGER